MINQTKATVILKKIGEKNGDYSSVLDSDMDFYGNVFIWSAVETIYIKHDIVAYDLGALLKDNY